MRYGIVYKQARTVKGGEVVVRDVAVCRGRIEKTAGEIREEAERTVDLEGRLFLLPGAVDMHVHMREPGHPHKEDMASGTSTAVRFGVTTAIDMPNTSPPTVTVESLLRKVEMAKAQARCRMYFYIGLTEQNLLEVERALSIQQCCGVKVYLGSSTGGLLMKDLGLVEKAVREVPALYTFHAELESTLARAAEAEIGHHVAGDHHVLRPSKAAADGCRFVLEVASRAEDAHLHLCHVSSLEEVRLLESSRYQRNVSSEVTPHHLYFDVTDVARQGNFLKVNPPIRTSRDRAALQRALSRGTIDVTASDHAPHTLAEKLRPYAQAPSGVPGVGTLVPAILRLVQLGVLDITRAVDAIAARPAWLAGLRDLGRVEEGFLADMMVWDPDATWRVDQAVPGYKCGHTPFHGMTLAAPPLAVYLSGREVFGCLGG